jgi:chaperonin GroES
MADRPKHLRPAEEAESVRSHIRMTNDRLLIRRPGSEGERKTRAGLLIPATAASENKRLQWAEVVAIGPHVRHIEPGDQVLINPEAGFEAEIRGDDYLLLREREVHAVASERVDGGTGLYL